MKELVELEEEDSRAQRQARSPTSLLERRPRKTVSPTSYLGPDLLGILSEKEIRERRIGIGNETRAGDAGAGQRRRKRRLLLLHLQRLRTRPRSAPNRKIMVLGGGPNRIGQGIEFDYCCVHAAFALRDEGLESIMVNCNPETVSTDYDTSDKLYFEPLTVEDVLSIYEKEKPEGVVVQFGGQTPLNIAGRAGRGRCEDPGNFPRNHRTGRRPRPLSPADAKAGYPPA